MKNDFVLCTLTMSTSQAALNPFNPFSQLDTLGFRKEVTKSQ